MVEPSFESRTFRQILGHYPTGVCAITSMIEDRPVGMIVGSFTSVSLDPPLVAFLPDRKSASWAKIESAGRFCVNVLSRQQFDVCRSLTSKQENKFENLTYRLSPAGLPLLSGTLAWLDCRLSVVHEAGDHLIAISRVEALDVEDPELPLLFFRGGYGSFASAPMEMVLT
jgi:3-hydroxy-9,10-secoandrosta-1,3,5(10)-triene-9,17-dione monooxygenase reductase component